jgi:hypothetical protein
MTFELAPHAQHPVIHNDGMKYDGTRLRAECRLAGKLYGQPFGVDVAFGDLLTEAGGGAPIPWTGKMSQYGHPKDAQEWQSQEANLWRRI